MVSPMIIRPVQSTPERLASTRRRSSTSARPPAATDRSTRPSCSDSPRRNAITS